MSFQSATDIARLASLEAKIAELELVNDELVNDVAVYKEQIGDLETAVKNEKDAKAKAAAAEKRVTGISIGGRSAVYHLLWLGRDAKNYVESAQDTIVALTTQAETAEAKAAAAEAKAAAAEAQVPDLLQTARGFVADIVQLRRASASYSESAERYISSLQTGVEAAEVKAAVAQAQVTELVGAAAVAVDHHVQLVQATLVYRENSEAHIAGLEAQVVAAEAQAQASKERASELDGQLNAAAHYKLMMENEAASYKDIAGRAIACSGRRISQLEAELLVAEQRIKTPETSTFVERLQNTVSVGANIVAAGAAAGANIVATGAAAGANIVATGATVAAITVGASTTAATCASVVVAMGNYAGESMYDHVHVDTGLYAAAAATMASVVGVSGVVASVGARVFQRRASVGDLLRNGLYTGVSGAADATVACATAGARIVEGTAACAASGVYIVATEAVGATIATAAAGAAASVAMSMGTYVAMSMDMPVHASTGAYASAAATGVSMLALSGLVAGISAVAERLTVSGVAAVARRLTGLVRRRAQEEDDNEEARSRKRARVVLVEELD